MKHVVSAQAAIVVAIIAAVIMRRRRCNTRIRQSLAVPSPLAAGGLQLRPLAMGGLQLGAASPLVPSMTACGRSFVASRTVSPAEVVLCVTPDASAPSWPCSLSELSLEERRAVQCESGSGGSFLKASQRDEQSLWLAAEVQNMWILSMRTALLTRSRPSVFTSLLTLEDHLEDRLPTERQVILCAARRLQVALSSAAAIELSERTLASLIGILLTNAFGLRGRAGETEPARPVLDVRASWLAISLTAALFNHSCAPNVQTDFKLCANGMLRFYAIKQIDEGDECLICYVTPEEPTYVRQRELRRSKLFVCTCALCTDPCEAGRCSSFLRCMQCKHGWQR